MNVVDRHGRLVAVRFVRNDFTSGGQKRPIWLFRCDCGKLHEARSYGVASGGTSSCGCLKRDHPSGKTHGASAGRMTPEYRSWRNMLTRGRNPNIHRADRYSLRGITVCDEWLPGGDGKGFERFLACVGLRPSQKHSLDRVDNDRGYEPGNVRWATYAEQVTNRDGLRMVEYEGEVLPLSLMARKHGISPSIVRDRLFKLKWPLSRALTQRPRAQSRKQEANI